MKFRIYIAFAGIILLSNVYIGIAPPPTATIYDWQYFLFGGNVSFFQANQFCVNDGKKLAVIRNRTASEKLGPIFHNLMNCK